MVFLGERYYNIYRIMLTIIGLWPYQSSIIVQVQTAFFFGAYSTFLFSQLTIFLTTTCSLEVIIKELSYIFITMLYIICYNSFYFNAKEIKQLLEQIKLDWNTIEDKDEIKILEKYAVENRLLSMILIILFSFSIFFLLIVELIPVILDTVVPINESRQRKLQIDFEFFIDEEKYFYVYLIHEITVVLIGVFTMLATGTLPIAFFRHCCAICKISSNLIENTVTKQTLQVSSHRKIYIMYQKISRAVHLHRKSIQLTKFFMKTMNKWYFVLLMICAASLSCNLLRLLNAATVLNEFSELIICFGTVMGHFLTMFIPNFIGQSFIDHHGEMFYAAYNTMWYLAPLPIQKLLLFVMQNSMKAHALLLGGIYVSCLEGFSTLVTTSISYFTVMYSMTTKQ
ncbi:hypothetical protein DMN91_009917 [Ooceraea biroi]|uniref:Odorant receptor n=1 Tax=Ooceraea biroi TaxID=2015173 RepID=A0A3L8DBH7_OOCBI|nr:hypothetical protein DMN91_009917 [Ooceraea biroi]